MFSIAGTYEPVGMFSVAHIISIFVCVFLIIVAVILTRKMQKATYFKMLKVFAVVFTCLELFKIIWSLANGLTGLDYWLPLYFCSLFIYALWFSYFKNEKIRDYGLSFIAMSGIIAGGAFILFPSTSFKAYPIWHFQCLYSMLYHSTFIYSSIMLFVTHATKIDFKLSLKYIIFCLFFMALAIIINSINGCNMMFLNNPGVIPIPLLKTIFNFSKPLYIIILIVAHLSMGLVAGIYMLIAKIVEKKKATIIKQ